jgi:hypothetical protein
MQFSYATVIRTNFATFSKDMLAILLFVFKINTLILDFCGVASSRDVTYSGMTQRGACTRRSWPIQPGENVDNREKPVTATADCSVSTRDRFATESCFRPSAVRCLPSGIRLDAARNTDLYVCVALRHREALSIHLPTWKTMSARKIKGGRKRILRPAHSLSYAIHAK